MDADRCHDQSIIIRSHRIGLRLIIVRREKAVTYPCQYRLHPEI